MTSMFVNAAFAPQPAVPASVIYKERPILDQVDAKKLAKALLTKRQGVSVEGIGKEPDIFRQRNWAVA